MLIKKAMICAVTFALLVAWGWLTDQKVPNVYLSRTINGADGDVIIMHTFPPQNLNEFLPREYVKILRYEDK
jgi:hypothetical protein